MNRFELLNLSQKCNESKTGVGYINSLAPGWCGSNFQSIIFRIITQISSLGTCCEIAEANATSIPWLIDSLDPCITSSSATMVLQAMSNGFFYATTCIISGLKMIEWLKMQLCFPKLNSTPGLTLCTDFVWRNQWPWYWSSFHIIFNDLTERVKNSTQYNNVLKYWKFLSTQIHTR